MMFKKVILAVIISILIISNDNLLAADMNFKPLVIYDDFISEEEKSLFNGLGQDYEYIKASEFNENKIKNSKYIVYLIRNKVSEDLVNSVKDNNQKVYIIGLTEGSSKFNVETMKYKNSTYRNNELKNIDPIKIGNSINIATINNSTEEVPYIIKKDNLYIQPNFNINNIVEKLITKDFLYDFFELKDIDKKEYVFFENRSEIYSEEDISELLNMSDSNNSEVKIVPFDLDNTTEIKQYSILRNGKLLIELEENISQYQLSTLENYIESLGFHKGDLNKELDNIIIEKNNDIYIIKDKVNTAKKTIAESLSSYFAILILILLIIFIFILRKNNKERRRNLFKE